MLRLNTIVFFPFFFFDCKSFCLAAQNAASQHTMVICHTQAIWCVRRVIKKKVERKKKKNFTLRISLSLSHSGPCVSCWSEFNMAAHRFETPTSTIDKCYESNDRQRKNENIGSKTGEVAKQQAIHKAAPCTSLSFCFAQSNETNVFAAHGELEGGIEGGSIQRRQFALLFSPFAILDFKSLEYEFISLIAERNDYFFYQLKFDFLMKIFDFMRICRKMFILFISTWKKKLKLWIFVDLMFINIFWGLF